MPDYTRRTHIVRVPMDTKAAAPGKQPQKYIDIEVLDAIAFRIENGQEVIIDMTTANSNPKIVDKTGGGNGKDPSDAATQLTHMKRISSGDKALDIEVVDCLACRDQNGEEWILDMQAGSDFYDTTDHTGDGQATRRLHDEKLYAGKKPTPDKEAGNKKFLTCQRSDNVAFRTINGKEVIFSIESHDDGSGDRASTYVWSPKNYDPTNDKGPQPPLLADSKDKHNYVAPVKSPQVKGFFTGKEKINMGPFWWIRKIHAPAGIGVLIYEYTSSNITSQTEEVDTPGQPPEQSKVKLFQLDVENDPTPPFKFKQKDGKLVDAVDPVNDDMLNNLLEWSRAVSYQTRPAPDSHMGRTGRAVLFFNLSAMDGFWPITVRVPGVPALPPPPAPTPTYWVWYNFGDPFPGFDPTQPQLDISNKSYIGFAKLSPDGNSIITTTNPFDQIYYTQWANNLTLATAVANRGSNAGSYHVETSLTPPPPPGPDTTTKYDWTVKFLTYDTRVDYPLDAQNNPLWTIADGLIASVTLTGEFTPGTPERDILITVDDALNITAA